MRFWMREVLGLLLVALGLGLFYLMLLCLFREPAMLVQASTLMIVGIVVFRGGIHLLRVATAARVCMTTPPPPAAPKPRPQASGQSTLEE